MEGLVRQPLGPALYQHYQKESYVSLKIKKKIKDNESDLEEMRNTIQNYKRTTDGGN